MVSVADSFAAEEIALRLRRGGVRWVFTQDVVHWGDKQLPLYEKVVASAGAATVVLAAGDGKPATLCGPATWTSTPSSNSPAATIAWRRHPRTRRTPINVLFSSGTTGEPKAIPVGPHHADQVRGRRAFPPGHSSRRRRVLADESGLDDGPVADLRHAPEPRDDGALPGSPDRRRLRTFVQDAGVTMLGVVPSLVRAWRQSGCMRRPRLEPHPRVQLHRRMLQPRGHALPDAPRRLPARSSNTAAARRSAAPTSPARRPAVHPRPTFTTPALGTDFVLLDEDGRRRRQGRGVHRRPFDRPLDAAAQPRQRRDLLRRHADRPRPACRSAVTATRLGCAARRVLPRGRPVRRHDEPRRHQGRLRARSSGC